MAATVLAPAPIRTAVSGPGGIVTQPWAQFFNKLFFAVGAVPAQLATTQTPAASTTASDLSIPIVLNGVTYYLRLSSTP